MLYSFVSTRLYGEIAIFVCVCSLGFSHLRDFRERRKWLGLPLHEKMAGTCGESFSIVSNKSTQTHTLIDMLARRALTAVPRRIVSVRAYTEGATGATRSDGSADSFTKREKAQEDFYIRKHQAEQIAALKEQLAKQKSQLEDLEKNINK